MSSEAADLLRLAGAWANDDPDDVTAAEVRALIASAEAGDAAALAELADRFVAFLAFGTAGLRGALGGGPNRMNRAVVLRAAAGLAAYLNEQIAGLADPSVPNGRVARAVIGYDARHGSAVFARDTAEVMTAAGIEAILLPRPWPTPVLAYAVRHLEADAGVMVTASHNPAADNGYKVYLGGRIVPGAGQGAQIVPPHDSAIAAHIDAVRSASEIPRTAGYGTAPDDIVTRYLQQVAASTPARPAASDLTIVTTAMHGVGGATLLAALGAAGVGRLLPVAAQQEPDPDFPTVAFPNPEEPGALDLAYAEARAQGADLVIAVDPDADRCAVAVPEHGTWRRLTGDEVGALLGAHTARAHAGDVDPAGAVLASSVVSSRQLAAIARAHGLRHRATLTGFKWISRVPGLVFGYEEALGYCVDPGSVRDKDGISAAVRFVSLAASLAEQGRTVLDALDDLAREHGVYATAPVTIRVSDISVVGPILQRLRSAPPGTLGGIGVTRFADLRDGLIVPDLDGGNGGTYGVPPTDGVLLETEDGSRVVIRPSGTEPKLKAYLEVVVAVDDAANGVTTAREVAAARLSGLSDAVRLLLA